VDTGVDRSDSGIFIFDCGTTYLHQLAHRKVRWQDVLCAGISKSNLSAFVKGGCCINYTPWLYGGRCEAAR
jgi:hypothetical protein